MRKGFPDLIKKYINSDLMNKNGMDITRRYDYRRLIQTIYDTDILNEIIQKDSPVNIAADRRGNLE